MKKIIQMGVSDVLIWIFLFVCFWGNYMVPGSELRNHPGDACGGPHGMTGIEPRLTLCARQIPYPLH